MGTSKNSSPLVTSKVKTHFHHYLRGKNEFFEIPLYKSQLNSKINLKKTLILKNCFKRIEKNYKIKIIPLGGVGITMIFAIKQFSEMGKLAVVRYSGLGKIIRFVFLEIIFI